MGPLVGAGLSLLGLPFAVGSGIDMLDRLNFDASGDAGRAADRYRGNANTAGWMGIMDAKSSTLANDLEVTNRSLQNIGTGRQDMLTAPPSEVEGFLEQLFAKEGMRLNNLGAKAKQMSYLDIAAQQGLI